MNTTFYRRPLPAGLVAFGSPAGRPLLLESLSAGTAESFYALISYLHTQADPAWCGLGTLVTVLNALEIDPGRVWKGPWRFFGEELLICCKALETMAATGLTLAEVACIAECNGARSTLCHAEIGGEDAFRAALLASVQHAHGPFMIANYDRQSLGQTGAGHFSPIAALHIPSDQALILDVARFKYPPHWVPVSLLWQAMIRPDPDIGLARGYLQLEHAPENEAFDAPKGLDALLNRLKTTGSPVCTIPCSPETHNTTIMPQSMNERSG